MNDTLTLLDSLRARGVRLRAVGDSLQVSASADADSDLLEALRAHREGVLDLLRTLPAGPALVACGREPHGSAPPLASDAQRRMWFLAQLDDVGTSYHLGYAAELRGVLDVAALERACHELVKRHAILRTTFTEKGGAVYQHVAPSPHPHFSRVDATGADERDVAALVRAQLDAPYALERLAPFRVALLRLASERHVIVIGLHHIVADGWSKQVLIAELGSLYQAQRGGAAPPPRDLQYTDYCWWQQQRLERDLARNQLAYWTAQLGDAPRLLELPTDFPRPPIQSRCGAARTLRFDAASSARLKNLAAALNATPFMVLLSGFYVTLSRFAQQRDIVVGTPVAGRQATGLEQLVGLFVNTLALRARVQPELSFAAFVEQVRETCLAAHAHQDLPFERIVEALNPERVASQSPVFQAMFTLQNAPQPSLELADVECLPLAEEVRTAKFDLTATLTERQGEFVATFEYCIDLFEADTIDAMAHTYAAILERAALGPADALCAIVLDCAHVHPEPRALDTPQGDIVTVFEAQAARTPDAVAIVGAEGMLTYGELNRRANRLALFLKGRADIAGKNVGLYLQRSAEAVVAMLAVLKAGATYVPLDPGYPEDRLSHMAADARLALCVAGDAQPSTVARQGVPVVRLRDCGDAPAACGAADGARVPQPEQTAYVIYTSGSTGTPKGIMVPHRGVVRLVRETNYVALDARTVVAHASTIAFDAATFEVFGALLNGGRLVLVPEDRLLMPEELAGFLAREHIGILFTTTALLNQVVRHLPGAFRTLDTLLFGGEFVDPAAVRAARQAGAPRRLLHVYGPTENTTFSSWHQIGAVAGDAVNIPIGKAVDHSALYVLDADGVPVPAGGRGELYTSGAGLAHGYIGAAAMTAAAFVPDPFSSLPGARMYRSGDVVRLRHDGAVEFIGRRDDQVKIRGFRIELGEIEAALCRCPEVAEAVVLAVGSGALRQLVAWLVPSGTARPEVAQLQRELRLHLPDYMMPARAVWLDRMPLNRNGKVDKKLLPPAPAAAPVAPGEITDPVEAELMRIWSAVLCAPVARRDQNFFDAGGSSLALMNVRGMLGETWPGLTVTISGLFAYPTIAALAHYVRSLQETREQGPRKPDARLADDVAKRRAALERRKQQVTGRREA